MSLWTGILSALTGGISDFFTGGSNLGDALGKAGREAGDIGSQNNLGNLMAKVTGSRLTDAEREANEWTASREDLAWQRTMEADNTKFQRQVQDMQAAGINPMLAAGSSVSAPAASSGSSVQPSSGNLGGILSSLVQFMLAKSEIGVNEATAGRLAADTKRINEVTTGQSLYNAFFSDTEQVRKLLLGDEHERYSWQRSLQERDVVVREQALDLQYENARHYNDMLDKQRELIDKEVQNNDLKRELLRANAREANANASYKNGMLAVDQELTRAQTDSEKERFEILKTESRLKNGIYTEDYIEAVGRAVKADADVKECIAAYQRGDYSQASKSLQKMFKALEKEGMKGTWSVGSQWYQSSQNAAASAQALPY